MNQLQRVVRRTVQNQLRRNLQHPLSSNSSDNSQSSMNWANIISFLSMAITGVALWSSILQNKESDRRYFENDSTSKVEQQRIRQKDSNQVATLTNSFTAQIGEYQRLRKVDSKNIAMYQDQLVKLNKSLEYQNQALELQRLANRANLSLTIRHKIQKQYKDSTQITPFFLVKNNGKSLATILSIKQCIYIETIKNNTAVYYPYNCDSATLFTLSISPDSTRNISNDGVVTIQTPLFGNTSAEIAERLAQNKFLFKWYYGIFELTYKDPYGTYTLHSLVRIVHNPYANNFINFPVYKSELLHLKGLKEAITKSGFNFEEIIKHSSDAIGKSMSF